jgi:hypothetical protein
MNWKTIELVENYWIILADDDGYTEYEDNRGDNLMFNTQQQALDFIKGINDGNL